MKTEQKKAQYNFFFSGDILSEILTFVPSRVAPLFAVSYATEFVTVAASATRTAVSKPGLVGKEHKKIQV